MRLAAVGDNCMDVYDAIGKHIRRKCCKCSRLFCKIGRNGIIYQAVGTDKYGKLMVELIASKGVDTTHVHFLEGNTAITHVELVNGNGFSEIMMKES